MSTDCKFGKTTLTVTVMKDCKKSINWSSDWKWLQVRLLDRTKIPIAVIRGFYTCELFIWETHWLLGGGSKSEMGVGWGLIIETSGKTNHGEDRWWTSDRFSTNWSTRRNEPTVLAAFTFRRQPTVSQTSCRWSGEANPPASFRLRNKGKRVRIGNDDRYPSYENKTVATPTARPTLIAGITSAIRVRWFFLMITCTKYGLRKKLWLQFCFGMLLLAADYGCQHLNTRERSYISNFCEKLTKEGQKEINFLDRDQEVCSWVELVSSVFLMNIDDGCFGESIIVAWCV